MKYIYMINGTEAELISQNEQVENVIVQDSFPAREERENCKAVLSYSSEDGIFWNYIPFTAEELCERAYKSERCIEWRGKMITVNKANEQWQIYSAEGDTEKTAALTALIADAKAEIRERYSEA